MSSATSTEPSRSDRTGLQPWQFYLLLSLIAATAAVGFTRHTQPAALVLLSGAILAAGVAAAGLHLALAGFFGLSGGRASERPLGARTRESLEREKMLILRAIKELEFDRAMGKVSDDDFADVGGRLRARALTLMADLDRIAVTPPPIMAAAPAANPSCPQCGTVNDPDALFCKQCGARIG